MFNTPLEISRPLKHWDGEGTTTTINPASSFTIWADPVVQDEKTLLAMHAQEDIRIGDIIKVPHDIFT